MSVLKLTTLLTSSCGKKNQHIKSYGHDQLPGFGTGAEEQDFFWKAVLRQALFNELLIKRY